MPLTAKAGGRDFDPIPEGVHIGTCYLCADIGTQKKTWQGKEKLVHQIIFGWEIPGETMEIEVDGQTKELPRVISQTYTCSLDTKATLRKHLDAWRGKAFTKEELEGFDLFNVIGSSCQIQITHTEKDGKTYANIASIMALPKGMPKPQPVHDPIMYSIEDGWDVPEGMYDWLRKKLEESEEWKARAKAGGSDEPPLPPPTDADLADQESNSDLPF